MAIISFPKNPLLKCWIFWIIVECTFKISYELKTPGDFQQLEDLVYGLILPWFCGAIWSDFKFLFYGVLAIHIYIVLVILLQIDYLIKNVKTWVWILFALGMFTIWAEPWITFFTHKSPEVLLSFSVVKEFLLLVDLTFSGLWLFLTYIICQLLDHEF